MIVENMKVSELAGMVSPYNPRKISDHDMAALRRSLNTWGVVEPVVVNRNTWRVVGGHQRIKAAEAENIAELPVVYVEVDEASEKQLNLALNRIHGDWDTELLEQVLRDLQAAEADLALTGFTDAEVEALLNPKDPVEEVDEDGNYESQYGVIVVCSNEAEQQRVYDALRAQGYNCKVVVT